MVKYERNRRFIHRTLKKVARVLKGYSVGETDSEDDDDSDSPKEQKKNV